jgi:hypothetical protein
MSKQKDQEKEILRKLKLQQKKWHHDIRYIEGRFIEDVVLEYQKTGSEDTLLKILANYNIFRNTWIHYFLPYCDNNPDAAGAMHDQIIWHSTLKFQMDKSVKNKGYAFNAYIVSALMNQLKNHHNARMSHKNHPRVTCTLCHEEVWKIDWKHLKHAIDVKRYQKNHPEHVMVIRDADNYKNQDMEPHQVNVFNPYTNKWVPELTEEMLEAIGTTLKEHLNKYTKFKLNKWYYSLVICPFTGKRTHAVTSKDLKRLGKTRKEFYLANCKYPLTKWAVKCAICNRYVDNIWTHLEEAQHNYAPIMTKEDYENIHGASAVQASVSTNSFLKNDSGDEVYIADLLTKNVKLLDPLEIEDSLVHVAKDDLDMKIAKAVRHSKTLEDVCYGAAEKKQISLPSGFKQGKCKTAREVIRKMTGLEDFDFVSFPKDGAKEVYIMTPGRDFVKQRLIKLIAVSDLRNDDLEDVLWHRSKRFPVNSL